MTRAYYSNSIRDFLVDSPDNILGQLTRHHNHALEDLQRNAWLKQIDILKVSLQDIENGYIFFEFTIPRMGKRVDNILLIDDSVFIIEFKVGSETYDNDCGDIFVKSLNINASWNIVQ
jgi:hypothetical protein